jgi:diguanylate cyclase (GGDEF)-like protein
MTRLNAAALSALAELVYNWVGTAKGKKCVSTRFLAYDNILNFLSASLPIPRADTDSLALPAWDGMDPSLISLKPDERQTKEWLVRCLSDLNSRSTPGHFLPAALETILQGVLTYPYRERDQRQIAFDLDRVLDLAGLGVDFTDGAYQIVARSPKEREREQKFKILYSARQAEHDFNMWTAAGLKPIVIFVDIDHFKKFNDKFTETRVDETLLPSFQRLVKEIVDRLGFAYRYGGEEFLLLLPHGSRGWAIGCAESVRERVEQHNFAIATETVRMTVSIGVAFSGQDRLVYEKLLRAANEAKNVAKRNSRNRVEIAPDNRIQPPA